MSLIHVVAGRDEGVLATQRFCIQGIGLEDGLLAASDRSEKEEDLAAHLKHVPVWSKRMRQRGAREFHGVGGGTGVKVQGAGAA